MLATLALAACAGAVEDCADYGEAQAMGQVEGELDEASGLAVSHQQENLVWAHNEKRIITGADILGRLMRGIASREKKRESGAEPTSSA